MLRWLASMLILATALASSPAIAETPYFTENGVAIRGYNPVAYFKQDEAVEGQAAHSLDWGGVTWHFASDENRAAFAAKPETYAPKYGGFCAYAAAQGSLASVDPHAWTIVGDRLYLNYSKNVQDRWERDIPGYVAKADANWPELNPAK